MTFSAEDAAPSGAPDSRHLAVVVSRGSYECDYSDSGKIEVSTLPGSTTGCTPASAVSPHIPAAILSITRRLPTPHGVRGTRQGQ